MGAHNLHPHICAWCTKDFRDAHALKQHQSATRHRDFVAGKKRAQNIAEDKMAKYNADKRKE